MNIDRSSIQLPPTKERMERLEEWCGVKLPGDYVDFIELYNGAVCLGDCSFDGGGRERMLERFLPLMADPNFNPEYGQYDVGVVMSQIDERLVEDEDAVGPRIIPIALLFAGDFLVLDYRMSAQPSVGVWDHEQSEFLSPHVDYVAASFADFVDSVGGMD